MGGEGGWRWWLWQSFATSASLLYNYFVRAALKWCLHVVTGKCELERIIDGYPKGGQRCLAIESSLSRSKRPDLRQSLSIPVQAVPTLVALISKVKYVSPKARGDFEPRLRGDLELILGYAELCRHVEWARKVKFDSGNEEHEALLRRLWQLMLPQRPLPARKSKEWQDIGFQGNDPSTDFRGMGLLGLEQMVWLFENGGEEAQRLYRLSLHPVLGFPFAIASITITAMVRGWLEEGRLKQHIWRTWSHPLEMEHFHAVYARVFLLFAAHWMEWNPASIMEFNVAKDDFQVRTLAHLRIHNNLPQPRQLQI